MKGLILKDLYLTLKYCRAFLVIVVVFIGVSFFDDDSTFLSTFSIFYPCIIAGMIPSTLYSYDEREKWCTYSATLPVSKAQFVSSKYIIGLFSAITIIILTAIVQAFKMLNTTFIPMDYLSIIAFIIAVCLVAPSVFMPFMFKFGAEKGRIIYYVVIGAACALFAIFSVNQGTIFILDNIFVISAICIGAAVIYIASWLLSISFYKKREI